MKKRCKQTIAMTLITLSLLGLVGCGGSAKSSINETGVMAEESFGSSMSNSGTSMGGWTMNDQSAAIDKLFEDDEFYREDTGEAIDPQPVKEEETGTRVGEEKLRYKASVNVEVTNFDEAVDILREKVRSLNGFIESEVYSDDAPYYYYDPTYNVESYNKSTKIGGYKSFRTTVRIPTAEFNGFVLDLSGIGHVTSSSSQVENITQEYYSIQAILDSDYNQLKALQGMYEKAETISEMLEIESRIAEVQAEINAYTTKITSMQTDVDYSTITIVVDEVEEYSDTPKEYLDKGFGQKVIERFQSSWDRLLMVLENLVYLVIDLIWFILFVAILAVIALYYLKIRRKKLIAQGRLTQDGKVVMPNNVARNIVDTSNIEEERRN